MIYESENSSLPSYLDITPGVIDYHYNKNRPIHVSLSNLTTHSVVISPRSVLCELQPIKIEENLMKDIQQQDDVKNIMEKITIDDNKKLTEQIQELLLKHIHTFSKDDSDIGNCPKVKHRIDLIDDIPFKQPHRRIPPNMAEEVRNHL
jgi:hypothetical protein